MGSIRIYEGMPLTKEDIECLEDLSKMTDADIDYSDIPATTEAEFKRFYRVNPRTPEEREQYYRCNPRAKRKDNVAS